MTLEGAVRLTIGPLVLDVELRFGDGELVALVGPNGAGKTTLLRAVAGLLSIDDGHITIAGEVVDDPSRGVFVPPERRSVGVMFQDYLLFPHMSARDNVAFGIREQGGSRTDARRRADAWLQRVGLGDEAVALPRQLSGGQLQRVALARALAVEPAVLLLDEPLAALDVQTRSRTRRTLREALALSPGARLLVTHDPVDALVLADRVLIMQDGRIVQEGSPDDVVSRPRSAYVADLVGLNLYRGRGDGALIVLDGGHSIVASEPHEGDVLAVVAPQTVALSRTRPESSARNVWPATVAHVERIGTRVRVQLTGSIPVIAEVTPAAVQALDLHERSEVWAAVKATEVQVYPA
jgi:molybdate transport system ATP-binding protein